MQWFEKPHWTRTAVLGTNVRTPGRAPRFEIPPETEAELTPAVKAFVVSLIDLIQSLTDQSVALIDQVLSLTEQSHWLADQVQNLPNKAKSRFAATLL